MAARIVALQEEGVHPPTEGILARFATVHHVRTLEEARAVVEGKSDIVLIDVHIKGFSGEDVLRKLRHAKNVLIITFDSMQPPRSLLRQFSQLRLFAEPRAPKLTFAQVVRLFGLSQESLARILRVSSRTVHRWLKGTRPRRKPELDRLTTLAAVLLRTLRYSSAVRQYLQHSNPSLGNERPVDLLLRGEFDRVAADLQAIEEGVYA